MHMTFNIYRDGAAFSIAQGDTVETGFVNEAAAADMAIRIAQDADATYTLNYWRP